MEGTRKNLQEELESKRLELGLRPEFFDLVFELPKKQFKKLSIRGPFIKMIYEYVLAQAQAESIHLQPLDEQIFYTQLPFIFEGIICVQYYENQILDGKGGVLKDGVPDLQKIRLNLLASHYLKDFLYDYAAKSVFPTDWSRREVLLDAMRRLFQFVDMGQYMEQRWSSLQNFHEGLSDLPPMSQEIADFLDFELIDEFWKEINAAGVDESKEVFVRFYLQRVYLTGAALFVIGAELVMDLLGYRGAERKRLRRFAGHYGMMCQLVNDNNDFLPAEYKQSTTAKNPEDAFSDLRNDNITLPMFFFFQENPEETCESLMLLPGMEIGKRFRKCLQEHSIPLAQKIAKRLEGFLTPENNISDLLEDLHNIAYKSRYRQNFEQEFNQKE